MKEGWKERVAVFSSKSQEEGTSLLSEVSRDTVSIHHVGSQTSVAFSFEAIGALIKEELAQADKARDCPVLGKGCI